MPLANRNINRLINNERLSQRELIMNKQKENLKYLKEVLGEIGFITELAEIRQQAPVVKFINHTKKAEIFNSLLSIMGLKNFRVTPRGRLVKLDTVSRNEINREENRRTQINISVRITADDIKLLADLLNRKRELIKTYLNLIKELEI